MLISINHLRQPLKCWSIACQTISSLVKGAPKFSPISAFIAKAVLQRREKLVFARIIPKVWRRYVDIIFVVIKKDKVSSFHQPLNTTLRGVELTMEGPSNDRSPFLGVFVRKLPSGDFKTPVYRKGTNANVFLHFNSTIQLATNAVVSKFFSADLTHITAVMRLIGKRTNTCIGSSTTMATH